MMFETNTVRPSLSCISSPHSFHSLTSCLLANARTGLLRRLQRHLRLLPRCALGARLRSRTRISPGRCSILGGRMFFIMCVSLAFSAPRFRPSCLSTLLHFPFLPVFPCNSFFFHSLSRPFAGPTNRSSTKGASACALLIPARHDRGNWPSNKTQVLSTVRTFL